MIKIPGIGAQFSKTQVKNGWRPVRPELLARARRFCAQSIRSIRNTCLSTKEHQNPSSMTEVSPLLIFFHDFGRNSFALHRKPLPNRPDRLKYRRPKLIQNPDHFFFDLSATKEVVLQSYCLDFGVPWCSNKYFEHSGSIAHRNAEIGQVFLAERDAIHFYYWSPIPGIWITLSEINHILPSPI